MNLFAPFNSDGYKLAHAAMYAEGTDLVYSNLTPRSDRIYRGSATSYYDGKLVLVGVQGALIEMVENWKKFFDTEKFIAIARFKMLCDNYLGRDAISTDNLAALHDLGYLPLEIKTLDEGSKVPMGVPVLTIKNTVKHAYWLVNFLETTISNLTWKTSTAATIATEYKAMINDYAVKTGSPIEGTAFQVHDFSARGMSGPEDAARTGFGHIAAGHLGTDSLGAILYAQEYYGAPDFVACSVPATEHAVATSNILRIERELMFQEYVFQNEEQRAIYTKMAKADEDVRLIAEVMFLYELNSKFPTGILSYVTDSFDFYGMISRGLPYMKDVIMRRESNGVVPGKLVIRPDSGDPLQVICGTVDIINLDCTIDQARDWVEDSFYDIIEQQNEHGEMGDSEYEAYFRVEGKVYRAVCSVEWNRHDKQFYYIDGRKITVFEEADLTAEQKGAVQVLWEEFGGTVTETGHRLLDSHIGLIYGDSITTRRCLSILKRLEEQGFASGNVVFGVGSYTYQCVTRDSFGFAVKATYTEVNGVGIAIFKDPKTDSKKKSAKGLLQVSRSATTGEYILGDDVAYQAEKLGELKTRFKDGVFYNLTTMDEIRSRL
jgi:nicotinamide phosphoribosyltransferase